MSPLSLSAAPLPAGHLALYLVVMALVTYLIRMIPFTLFRKEIKSAFFRSFLAYVPYAVLGAMTIPAVFSSTGSLPGAIAGVAVAVVLGWLNKGLLTVAAAACAAAYLVAMLIH